MATLRATANGKIRLNNSSVRFRATHIDFGVDKTAPEHPLAARTQNSYNQKFSSAFPRGWQSGTILLPEPEKLTSDDSDGATCDTGGRRSRRTPGERPDDIDSRRNTPVHKQCCTLHNRRGHSRRNTLAHSRRSTLDSRRSTLARSRRNTLDSRRSNRSQDRNHRPWRPGRRSPHRRSGRPRGRHPNPSHPWLRLETAPSPSLTRAWRLLPKRVLSSSWFAPFRVFPATSVERHLKLPNNSDSRCLLEI